MIGQELPTKDGTSIILKWDDSPYDEHIKLDKYNLYISTNQFSSEINYKSNAQIKNSITNSIIITNLNFGTTYFFAVTALRNYGYNGVVETEISNCLIYTVPSTNNYISIIKSNGFYEVRYKVGPLIPFLNYTNLIKYDLVSLK